MILPGFPTPVVGRGTNPPSLVSVLTEVAFPNHNNTQVSSMVTWGSGFPNRELWVAVVSGGSNSEDAFRAGIQSVRIGGSVAELVALRQGIVGTNLFSICAGFYRISQDTWTGALVEINTENAWASAASDTHIHTGFVPFTVENSSSLYDQEGWASSSGSSTGTLGTKDGFAALISCSQNNSSGAAPFGWTDGAMWDIGTSEWSSFGYVNPTTGANLTAQKHTGGGSSPYAYCAVSMSG